jgi:hypothetical protein
MHTFSRKGVQMPPKIATQLVAYSVDEFCAAHGPISRGTLYNMWRDGIGPRFMIVGSGKGRRIISIEAAAEWRREREAAAMAETAA